MNMQQWITPLMKMAKKQNYFKLIRTKRKNNGMWWASFIGLGISVIALVKKWSDNKEFNPATTTQNLINNMKNKPVDIQKFLSMQDKSLLAEFSKEITPKEAPKNVPKPQNHTTH